MITKQRPIEHDRRRCPECEGRGVIDEFRTREHPPNTQERIKARVFECETDDCDTRWIKRS